MQILDYLKADFVREERAGLAYMFWGRVWAGVAAIVSWSAGYFWVVSLPETRLFTSGDVLGVGKSLEQVLDRVIDPNAVDFARWVDQTVFLAAITLILTVTVWRPRRLVIRQVAAESQRLALSRYFSPNIMRELTANQNSLDQPKVQQVAVLFAGVAGFMTLSKRLLPLELLALLRQFHGRLARTALDHGGTLDKYIGDAIMVHFGTPKAREDDAVRALCCAAAKVAEIEGWNKERLTRNLDPIRIGIGLHYGDVIVGNTGDERRLEYTVPGDTVNVASRLEALTRKLDATLVTSDPVIDVVRDQETDPTDIPPDFKLGETESVRGRSTPVRIWYQPANRERKIAPFNLEALGSSVGASRGAQTTRHANTLTFQHLIVAVQAFFMMLSVFLKPIAQPMEGDI